MEIWEPKTPGTLWATPGPLRDCFTFTVVTNVVVVVVVGAVFTPTSVSLTLPSFRNLGSQSNMSVHAGGSFSEVKEDRA